MTAQHVDEPLPLLGRGNGGIRSPIAPGRRVQHEPVGRVRLTGRGPDRGARSGASGLGRSLREHVDARLPRHGHALVGQSERGLEATAHEMRRRRQHTDPVRRCRGTCDARTARTSPRTGKDAAADGLGGVEADALERNAVPQLHDERVRHGVAVHVAEPVGDDDHARTGREPEPPQRALARMRDAEGCGIPSLARASRPARSRCGPRRRRRSTAPRRRRRCRPRSRRPSSPFGVGSGGSRCGRARTAGGSRASARFPRRTRKTPPREPIAGWRPDPGARQQAGGLGRSPSGNLPLVLLELAQGHVDRLRLAVADEGDGRIAAGRCRSHLRGEIGGVGHRGPR